MWRLCTVCSEVAKGSFDSFPLCCFAKTCAKHESTLLVACIIFIVRIGELANDPSVRVLVSSATNVAVDRILLALRAQEFEQFLRVGSLRKIARDILPYSVHRSSRSDSGHANAKSNENDDRDAARDLKHMLANEPNLSAARRRALTNELLAVESVIIILERFFLFCHYVNFFCVLFC